MKWILKKLRGSSGASIILALLFLLLCMMVGASVLAAASSNAGKVESRRIEQQRHFAVSSALELVADRIEAATYTAKATVEKVTVSPDPAKGPYPDADTPDDPGYDEQRQYMDDPAKNYSYTIYRQDPGEFRFDIDNTINDQWKGVLPIIENELEWLFARTFARTTRTDPAAWPSSATFEQFDGDEIYLPLDNRYLPDANKIKEPSEHVLTITPGGLMAAAGEPGEEVEVTVRLGKNGDEQYRIFLEARLEDTSGNVLLTLGTEMTPTIQPDVVNTPGEVRSDSSSPIHDVSGYYPGTASDLTCTKEVKSFKYEVKWTRGLIEKK